MRKLLIISTLFILYLCLINISSLNVYAINSPISHKAEIVSEKVNFNGSEVDASGYIAYTDENGNKVILSVGDESSVTIDTNLESNDKLKAILKQINEADTLSVFNSKLDSIAQSINKEYNGSVFVPTDLFEITISNELKTLLDSNEDYYYSIKLNLELSGDDKPVVMHQNESTGEWIIVDSNDVKVEKDGVSINFDSLCPVMVLNVNEEVLNKDSGTVPLGTIIVLSFILLMLIIYMIASFARKKMFSK